MTDATEPLKPITGTWRQLALIVDGEQVPVVSGVTLAVDEDGYTVKLGNRLIQRGTSTSNYDEFPHQADATVTEGRDAGKTLRQIFKIEGDLLISCVSLPGAERPKEFTSSRGSGHSLSVWLRTEAVPATPMTKSTKLLIGGTILAALLIGAAKGDLAKHLGHWAEVAASGIVAMLALAAVGLILSGWLWGRWDTRGSFVAGLVGAIALTTFSELRPPLEPAIGVPLAHVVSLSTAFVAGAVSMVLFTRVLKIWLPR